MRAKCGQIITWHWAHMVGEGCDAYGLEGAWHLDWKSRMAEAGAQIEVLRREGGQCHIADVVLPSGWVLELAGTYHSADVIAAREEFYGKRMSWLYRADDFIERTDFWAKDDGRRLLRFKQPPKSMLTHHRWPIFWNDSDGDWIYAIKKLWGWGSATYGELVTEGDGDEFVDFAIKEME